MDRADVLSNSRAFIVEGVLSDTECARHILDAEHVGFTDAPINAMGGTQIRPDVRNNSRAMRMDEALATTLWTRVSAFFDETNDVHARAHGLNPMFRYYRYEPLQRFAWHFDGTYHPKGTTLTSLYTFMVYLNDDFEGGSTKFSGGTAVRPKTGMGLFFAHDLLHEGSRVRSGRKYVLRTDVLFDIPARFRQDSPQN